MNRRWFIVHLALATILLLAHGYEILQLDGSAFGIGLVVFLLLLILAATGFLTMSRATWAAFYTLGMFNAIFIFVSAGFSYLAFFVPLAGYLLTLSQRRPQRSRAYEPPSEIVIEPVTTSFSPGKYIASSNSNKYHSPKCEWGKKIKKDRQVWFADDKEAKKKGYSKHSCLD